MTALALFAAFMVQSGIDNIDISEPTVMAGLFVGGMLPFLFSSMDMSAFGRASMAMIELVDFNEIYNNTSNESEAPVVETTPQSSSE